MCAATAAAVGTAVAAVAAVGTQVAGAVSSKSSSGGAASASPKTKPIPGFGPATGLQSYTARLLAANKNTRTPGIMEWAESGGTLRPDWKVPDFTPKEAGQLGFVDKVTGKPIPGFDPDTDTRLSPEATAWAGRERTRSMKASGLKGSDVTVNPQQRYGQLSAREEMLQSRIASGSTPKLEKKLAKVQTKKTRVGQKLGL